MNRSILAVPLLAIFVTGCAFADSTDHAFARDAKIVKAVSPATGAVAMKDPSHSHGASEMKGHSHMADDSPMMMAQGTDQLTDGEITRISKGAKKLTIKHGEIKNLEMPPMTMVFTVSDEKMLEMVKKGDKVKFKVEVVDGQMVVTEIMPQ